MGEARGGEAVGKQSHAARASCAREGKRRLKWEGRRILPGDSHGKCIALMRAATQRQFDVAENCVVLRPRQRCYGGDLDVPYTGALVLKPAAFRDVERQDVAFELVFGPMFHGLCKTSPQHKRAVLDEGRRRRRTPCRRRFVLAELEPVKAVRRQRQQIRELADHAERRTARQFDRRSSREFVQFQFDRLRRSRDVRHAKNRVALHIRADKRALCGSAAAGGADCRGRKLGAGRARRAFAAAS